jgi:glyoxylase-like metal-dependent hydrolase (beta-lactamase superfamily II)
VTVSDTTTEPGEPGVSDSSHTSEGVAAPAPRAPSRTRTRAAARRPSPGSTRRPPADTAKVHGFTPIDVFRQVNAERLPGRQLDAIREAAPAFQEWFRKQGQVSAVRTGDLVGLPYPTEYALFRANHAPAGPFVRIVNRMMIVQWRTDLGDVKTLVVEPTDVQLAESTAYFSGLRERFPGAVADRLVGRFGTVEEHLAAAGIRPEDVDYITFDHLHTQDVRRWLGTTAPQPDLADKGLAPRDEALQPYFPNAKLLIMRPEWEQFPGEHPLQRKWYQGTTYPAVRTDNVVLLDTDVLLGPGVALMFTPGHTVGNHSIVLNTSSGVWTVSENGMHAEAYTPERSKIPGLRDYHQQWGFEVVLNSNTPESSGVQYNSMVKEKLVADRGGPGGEWVQHFPSSEMVPWKMAFRTEPSFTYGAITEGDLALGAR